MGLLWNYWAIKWTKGIVGILWDYYGTLMVIPRAWLRAFYDGIVMVIYLLGIIWNFIGILWDYIGINSGEYWRI